MLIESYRRAARTALGAAHTATTPAVRRQWLVVACGWLALAGLALPAQE